VHVGNSNAVPRRIGLLNAFTNNPAKISNSHNLVLIPKKRESHPIFDSDSSDMQISLFSPDNETVLRLLTIGTPGSEFRDVRTDLNRTNRYEEIKLSDKGEYHRGVMSHFEDGIFDAVILTNSFWRNILTETFEGNGKQYELSQFKSKINDYSDRDLASLVKQFRFENTQQAKMYLRASLLDAVEYLVHLGVLNQVFSWRCTYCGNKNVRSLDTLSLENSCTVCATMSRIPIDFIWKYSFSPFVVDALSGQNGLIVLWGIHKLIDFSRLGQSIYLPEVDLFRDWGDKNSKNEVDFLAVIDGQFVAAEVKTSASSLVNSQKEIDKLIDEMARLCPDVCYLIFEKYSRDDDETEAVKKRLNELVSEIQQKVPQSTEIRTLVAMDHYDYSEIPREIGPYGKRTWTFLDSLDRKG